jgi:hypothetical protein
MGCAYAIGRGRGALPSLRKGPPAIYSPCRNWPYRRCDTKTTFYGETKFAALRPRSPVTRAETPTAAMPRNAGCSGGATRRAAASRPQRRFLSACARQRAGSARPCSASRESGLCQGVWTLVRLGFRPVEFTKAAYRCAERTAFIRVTSLMLSCRRLSPSTSPRPVRRTGDPLGQTYRNTGGKTITTIAAHTA